MKRFDEFDAVLAFGLLLLSSGAALVYLPLGLIVPGVVLTAVAVAWARPARRKDR